MSNRQPKVLLVNPPSEFKTPLMPLGLAYIAAFLKTKGIEVSVIDAWAEQINFEELGQRLSQREADIVGIYIVSPRYNEGKMTIELCRKVFPKAMIAAGGPHPSAVADEMLKENTGLDVCVIGEGEITMYELAENLKNKSDLSVIDGIAFRDKQNGEIVRTLPRDFIKNLDELPFPGKRTFSFGKIQNPSSLRQKKPLFFNNDNPRLPFPVRLLLQRCFQR